MSGKRKADQLKSDVYEVLDWQFLSHFPDSNPIVES